MLELRQVTYRIRQACLLDHIDLQFHDNKLNLIVGPNGAGKSTLLKVISQQIAPKHGEVLFYGKPLKDYTLADLAKRRAVLSQHIELAFSVSVADLVMMGRTPYFSGKPSSHDADIVQEVMQYFDLVSMQGRDVLTLSGGEKQRAHFARVAAQIWERDTIANASSYLLLDEPLSFLDVYYQFEFMHKLQALIQDKGMTIIGVVHDLNLAAKFADHLVLLHQGKVLAAGTKEQVFTENNIEKAYRLKPHFHQYLGETQMFFA
jgi:iron complex transport system ATP-binding protein